ncbi:MAG: hypothetical protein ACREV3_14315 [Gammaproteobacteria bacterium]
MQQLAGKNLGVGVGLGLLVSQIDPVIYSRRDLLKVATLPVFGTVSWSETAGSKGSLLETNRYFFLAITILVLGYLVIIAMYQLQVGLLTKLAGFGSLFLGPG